MQVLLRARANVHAQTHDCWTPLHYAATAGDAGAVQVLLAFGASKHAKTTNGSTPKDLANIYTSTGDLDHWL